VIARVKERKKEAHENRGSGSEGAIESGEEDEGGRGKDNCSLDETMVIFVMITD
jgi:hypothetical protein